MAHQIERLLHATRLKVEEVETAVLVGEREERIAFAGRAVACRANDKVSFRADSFCSALIEQRLKESDFGQRAANISTKQMTQGANMVPMGRREEIFFCDWSFV